MKGKRFRFIIGIVYLITLIALTALFFTNDFGIVDLRKTSVIIGVGLDVEEEDVVLCAQVAIPRPAENGESTSFSTVTGRGKTVASALNQINVKTGFYPKLVFCKLVLLGESCLMRDVNTLLNYFYDNEYTGLTPKLAACKGSAADMLSLSLPFGDSTTDFIERVLSDEAKKSGNVSSIDLNTFGQQYFGKGASSYMPYIQCFPKGEEQGAFKTSATSGDSKSGGEGGGDDGTFEFLCDKTAVFTQGYCKGILQRNQAFALNLIKNRVRHAFIECAEEGDSSVLGLRGCKGDAHLSFKNGAPQLTISFRATAKLMDDSQDVGGKTTGKATPEEVLICGKRTLEGQFEELFAFCKQTDCDVLGVKDMLYKNNHKYYSAFNGNIYQTLTLLCNVNLKSVN